MNNRSVRFFTTGKELSKKTLKVPQNLPKPNKPVTYVPMTTQRLETKMKQQQDLLKQLHLIDTFMLNNNLNLHTIKLLQDARQEIETTFKELLHKTNELVDRTLKIKYPIQTVLPSLFAPTTTPTPNPKDSGPPRRRI